FDIAGRNQADATMPVEYEPTPNSVIAHYANGVKLVLDFLKTPFGDRPGWVQDLGTCPVRFVGDEGWVEAGDSGGIEVSSAALRSELKHLETSPTTGGLDVSAHARNFFDCIKSRSQTAANPQVMRHSHIACHAAALAWMLGRKLRLDPVREEFLGDPKPTACGSGPLASPGVSESVARERAALVETRPCEADNTVARLSKSRWAGSSVDRDREVT
ncbi:MAG: hypothetical protein ABSE84_24910, partial [Isosphaeraceae bacterium]